MSNKKSFLQVIRQVMNDYETKNPEFTEDHKHFLLFGIEFDEEGFPVLRVQRTMGSFADQVAGLELLERMIKATREDLFKRIDDSSKKVDYSENEKENSDSELSVKPNLHDLISNLKKRFDQLKNNIDKNSPNKPDKPVDDATDKVTDVLNNVKGQFGFDGNASDINIQGKLSLGTESFDDSDDD